MSHAHWAVLAAAVLFSTGGAAIKACQLTGWQVAGFRSGIAAAALALLLPEARRVSGPILLVALAYAVTLITFVIANKLTTAAHAIFLQSAAPIYVVFLERLFLGNPILRRDLPVFGAVGAGLLLLFFAAGPGGATAPDPVRGNSVAVTSGLGYAVLLVGLRWLAQGGGSPAAGGATPRSAATTLPGRAASGTSSAPAATLWGNLLAFGICLPFAIPVVDMRPVDALVLVYLGVVQIGLAYYLLTRAVRTISALDVSLLLLLEPALNPLWVWALQGESPGAWAIAGGVLVVGATAWRALRPEVAPVR